MKRIQFEEAHEGYVNSLKETLLVLNKNQVQNTGLRKELFEDLIHRKEDGLRALLDKSSKMTEIYSNSQSIPPCNDQ